MQIITGLTTPPVRPATPCLCPGARNTTPGLFYAAICSFRHPPQFLPAAEPKRFACGVLHDMHQEGPLIFAGLCFGKTACMARTLAIPRQAKQRQQQAAAAVQIEI